jgi:hypothetical protein
MQAVLTLGERNPQDTQTEKHRHIHKKDKEVPELQPA